MNHIDHNAMKLLLGDGPKDGGSKEQEMIILQGERMDVSKFIVEGKWELRN